MQRNILQQRRPTLAQSPSPYVRICQIANKVFFFFFLYHQGVHRKSQQLANMLLGADEYGEKGWRDRRREDDLYLSLSCNIAFPVMFQILMHLLHGSNTPQRKSHCIEQRHNASYYIAHQSGNDQDVKQAMKHNRACCYWKIILVDLVCWYLPKIIIFQ